MRVVFFGDSICRGHGAEPGRSWVEQVAGKLRAGFPELEIHNAGVNGDISTEALRRMKKDVEEVRPDLVYAQFGLNDCSWWCRKPGHLWVAPGKYGANMREIAARARACGASVVLVGTNHLPGGPDTDQEAGEGAAFAEWSHARRTALYNRILRNTFPRGSRARLVDLERELPQDEPLVLADNVHLNARGNALYAEIIRRAVEAALFPAGAECTPAAPFSFFRP